MKKLNTLLFFLIGILIIFISCSSDDDISSFDYNINAECEIQNIGIFYESGNDIIYCTIDSSILTNHKFEVWFNDITTQRNYKAAFFRHDNELIESGLHYFISEFDEWYYHHLPPIQFIVEDLDYTEENPHLVLYDKFDVCIEVDTVNYKYGISIEGIKIFNSALGHDFLTFSIDNQNYSKR